MVKPRILVIRGGAIGDFILTLPALRLLRDNFPHAHLEILGYRHIISVADGRYYADATRSIEYAGLSRFFMPNVARDPELESYFASFQQVVSYLYDPDGFFEASVRQAGVKNFLSGPGRLDDSAHASEQLARPLAQLALFLDRETPELFPSETDHAAIAPLLDGRHAVRIALHVGSGSPRKNWPIQSWRELAAGLLEHLSDAELLLLSGEADEELVHAMTAVLAPERVRIVHARPLPEVAALLGKCALFVGHDSGISHLAAATGIPTVVIFGPTDPAVWAPRNTRATVIRAPEGNLAHLPASEVLTIITRLLAPVDQNLLFADCLRRKSGSEDWQFRPSRSTIGRHGDARHRS